MIWSRLPLLNLHLVAVHLNTQYEAQRDVDTSEGDHHEAEKPK